jgi:dihydropteroate synthase
MRPVFEWNIGSRTLLVGKRTLIMGVVNVTPDSFSDGGLFLEKGAAVDHALKLLDDGADIVDIGGESTRPGAHVAGSPEDEKTASKGAVSEKEELDRVIPVVSEIKKKRKDACISVDTYKASVAKAAFDAGAEVINDISGFRWDAAMRKTLAELKCGAVLMHTRGRPEEWRKLAAVGDIVTLVKRELREWLDAALMAGMKRERIALDPGFGFGKNFEQNYPLLKLFDELHALRCPLVAGVSRKSFIGRAVARGGKDADVSERLLGTLAAETALILKGAQIIRTHDVRATWEAVRIADLVVG